GAISARAHVRAMQVCRPGLWEYQLEAELLHEFIRSGSRAPAYSSIVGSGPNSCILHYRENNRQMADGELVLIDAGCEFEYYASDITRTFPVNGTFSGEQRALYEVVLTAQQAAIDATRPGASWNQPHDASVRVITEGLLALGLLSGELNELIETEACKPYYMHRAGHWLGMDVHDVGEYKVAGAWRMLEPGMTMTVEPGIYVALNQSGIDPRWRGIGIRIEDDVAVTRNGVELLTPGVPKQIDEIEALMAEARGRQP
ncbi:MAG TPA: M24 family metallopeptidase, partial [Pseudomonadales bacterium]|nr:M24 family metallopeptidase [Pseudomonadales bacterium]